MNKKKKKVQNLNRFSIFEQYHRTAWNWCAAINRSTVNSELRTHIPITNLDQNINK